MNEIPTPETDSWCGYGIGGLEVVPASRSRSLERRLTIAREALTKINNSVLSPKRILYMCDEALKQTAPKP